MSQMPESRPVEFFVVPQQLVTFAHVGTEQISVHFDLIPEASMVSVAFTRSTGPFFKNTTLPKLLATVSLVRDTESP